MERERESMIKKMNFKMFVREKRRRARMLEDEIRM